jgi:hypothetical protein
MSDASMGSVLVDEASEHVFVNPNYRSMEKDYFYL